MKRQTGAERQRRYRERKRLDPAWCAAEREFHREYMRVWRRSRRRRRGGVEGVEGSVPGIADAAASQVGRPGIRFLVHPPHASATLPQRNVALDPARQHPDDLLGELSRIERKISLMAQCLP